MHAETAHKKTRARAREFWRNIWNIWNKSLFHAVFGGGWKWHKCSKCAILNALCAGDVIHCPLKLKQLPTERILFRLAPK